MSEVEKPVFIRSRVPESVRARFKAACALQSRDMSEVLEELINKWLEEYEAVGKGEAKRSKADKSAS